MLFLSTIIRSNELTIIKTGNVDLKGRRIYLDKTKTKPQYTPITPELLPILDSLMRNQASIWLFSKKDNMNFHITTEAIRSFSPE